ncbi:hypothetical protein SD70_10690 [Gordoniibacillus kamchatkensis]|uniref:MFS transporter n=1 Tax=Gordoniibacillus kamchatkensis TaxID=1590651 RepID=A0ABR5AKK0_9BACL|nr:MFS transporter [Paenibacillus sp. VKM B-2647]KIL40887.1 hypothetical protein SD70_10690 [Paenibacillus sp. VKM B-2647]
MKLSSVWSSFGNHDFRLMWFSSALSNSANWSYMVGVGWLLYTLSHSSLWVGFGMFATMIPVILIGPYAGVLADKFNRRKIYTAAQALSACFVALQLAAHLSGNQSLWLVIACSLGLGITSSTQLVMSNAMIPVIVHKEKLHNAAALMGVVSHGAEFFGAGLATPLLAGYGVNAVIGLSVVLYAGAALCSARIAIRDDYMHASAARGSTVLRSLLDGFTYIRLQPIGLLILLVGLHCALTMSFNGLLPSFSSHRMEGMEGMDGMDGSLYGSIMTFVGLGAVLGNLSTAGVSEKRLLVRIYAVTAVGSGLSLSFLAFTYAPWMTILMAFFVGATQAVFMASSNALIMQRTDPSYQGRVSSVYIIIAAGLMALCNLGYGSLGTIVSPAAIMMSTGFVFVVLFVAIGLLSSLRSTLKAAETRPTGVPM